MIYRAYGNTGKKLSALSFGGNRFSASDLQDDEGLDRCAALIEKAAALGINYFDTAHYYCASKSEEIFRRAYKRLKLKGYPFYTCAKSGSNTDFTADAVMGRVESSLKNMDLDTIDFFYMWGIMDEDQYRDIMRKDGPYAGALRAKEQGMIQHIVFSSHLLPEAACKVIREGAFEGITISYSIINYPSMGGVLKAAREANMGVAVMNPLAGGLIPQNAAYFAERLEIPVENVVDMAHRFILGHKEITTILSGVGTGKELLKNISGVEELGLGILPKALQSTGLEDLQMCTGCAYCRDCPAKIPISVLMQSYNKKLFSSNESYPYGNEDKRFLEWVPALKQLSAYFNYLPEGKDNPCLGCGKCEKVCTQKLPIRDRLERVYQEIEYFGVSQEQHKTRLNELLHGKGYTKVALYTAGGYTEQVLSEYKQYFGDPAFQIVIFDKNCKVWGGDIQGYPIYSPEKIPEQNPDCILIPSYKYGNEIYGELKPYQEIGIDIVCLHGKHDMPWIY